MSQAAAMLLVKSLSKSEKRHFKLSTKKQSGNKDYLKLFDLIDQTNTSNKKSLSEDFKKLNPNSSIENASRYLVKLLSDCLIQSRIKEDNSFQLLHGLMRVNLLRERNLATEAFKELQKLQQLAVDTQETSVQYLTHRYEMKYFSELNFEGLTENQLVEKQTKARYVLKEMRNTHEHYSLYELLKFRLVYSGKIISESEKKKLDDLLLSEMSIISSRLKSGMESRKIHLLFQSFFFINIGDHRSALKTFYELNRLYEKNTLLWSHPPRDYFIILNGILSSLRITRNFKDMEFYIQRMELLNTPAYPEYFRYLVLKSIMIYKLNIFLGTKKFEDAVDYIDQCDSNLVKAYSMVDKEIQSELLFFMALSYYYVKKIKKAQKYINETLLIRKIDYQSIVFKASRLLGLLINYHEKNIEYLDYEIRSYKRSLIGHSKSLQTEKLIFKVIKMNPDFNSDKKNEILWKSISPVVQKIEKNKYELQLLKYFNFTDWVRTKFKN